MHVLVLYIRSGDPVLVPEGMRIVGYEWIADGVKVFLASPELIGGKKGAG